MNTAKIKTLQKGSKVAIVAPARKVTPDEVQNALVWLQDNGLIPVYDQRLFASHHIFAGDDVFRTAVMQDYLDRPDIDAIWLARGGYGSVHIIDRLDFTRFSQHPKLFVGFSDGTIFHAIMQNMGFPSLHAPMPYNFLSKTPASKQSLLDALMGKQLRYDFPFHAFNRMGKVTATVVGGNLSVLYGLLGSSSFPETAGKILFIEEVDEYVYHVERMMIGLKRAGKLRGLKALLVGGLTEIHDNQDTFGKSVEEAIFDVVRDYNYPVCFGFPSGHFSETRAFFLGKELTLDISKDQVVAMMITGENRAW